MSKHIIPAVRATLILTFLTGLVYPGLVTALCQIIFPHQANGSLITMNGQVVGSELVGQVFAQPRYFHPRPSSAGPDGYDASASGGSNLGPTSQQLVDRVRASVEQFRADNPDFQGLIPSDIVTVSSSGLDPDISPASAEAQASRIAKARGIPLNQIQELIGRHIEQRKFVFLGDPRVNVLALNLDLDRDFPSH